MPTQRDGTAPNFLRALHRRLRNLSRNLRGFGQCGHNGVRGAGIEIALAKIA